MKNLPTPANREDAVRLIEQIKKERRENQEREMHLNARMQTMKGQALVGSSDLGPNILKVLPPNLAPKNIGEWGSIMWDFFYPVVVDFGTNPVYGPNTRTESNFKVNQDGSFLLCGISRMYSNTSFAGKKAPLSVTIRDLQSTRQFNDISFPIQNIGERGQPTLIETPLLVYKNSNISGEVTSWLPETMATVGSGRHEFLFFGLRVRDEETVKLLQTLFV